MSTQCAWCRVGMVYGLRALPALHDPPTIVQECTLLPNVNVLPPGVIYNTSYMSETDDSFTLSLSRQGVTLFQGRSGSWSKVKRQFRLQLEAGRYVMSSCHIDRRLVIKSGSSYIPGQLHACEPYTPCYHESTVPQNPLAATAATARMFFLWELK